VVRCYPGAPLKDVSVGTFFGGRWRLRDVNLRNNFEKSWCLEVGSGDVDGWQKLDLYTLELVNLIQSKNAGKRKD
jgi:hypothetical protein